MSYVLIAGLGIVGFLLAYLFFNFGKDEISQKHYLLRLLLIGCLFGVFVLIGKAALDSSETCELVHNYTDNVYVYGNSLFYTNGTPRYHWEYEEQSLQPQEKEDIRLFHIYEYKDYERVCFKNNDASTGLTFYRLTLWIVRLISAYILVYLFYEIFMYLNAIIRGKRGRSRND